jgi:hypothetical protein
MAPDPAAALEPELDLDAGGDLEAALRQAYELIAVLSLCTSRYAETQLTTAQKELFYAVVESASRAHGILGPDEHQRRWWGEGDCQDADSVVQRAMAEIAPSLRALRTSAEEIAAGAAAADAAGSRGRGDGAP